MPLYEYECDACGERFEVIQKSFSDPPPAACEKCGKGPVRRLMSSPAIQFKGSGFYITDYKKSGGGGDSGKSSSSGSSDSSSSESKSSESKSTDSKSSDSKSSDTSSTPPAKKD